MKTKSATRKASTGGKQLRAEHRNGNGNGNGNGGGHATESHHDAGEDLKGQPSILSLLRGHGSKAPSLIRARFWLPLLAEKGDFTVRLPIDLEGVDGKIADAFNDVVELNQHMAQELERLSRVVGRKEKSASGRISAKWGALETFGQVRQ